MYFKAHTCLAAYMNMHH